MTYGGCISVLNCNSAPGRRIGWLQSNPAARDHGLTDAPRTSAAHPTQSLRQGRIVVHHLGPRCCFPTHLHRLMSGRSCQPAQRFESALTWIGNVHRLVVGEVVQGRSSPATSLCDHRPRFWCCRRDRIFVVPEDAAFEDGYIVGEEGASAAGSSESAPTPGHFALSPPSPRSVALQPAP